MFEIRETPIFSVWIAGLRDRTARARILDRIHRVGRGLLGDVRPIGSGLSELRIDHGPGYRVYFVQRGRTIVVLLCGGDKGSQQRDIAHALQLAASLED